MIERESVQPPLGDAQRIIQSRSVLTADVALYCRLPVVCRYDSRVATLFVDHYPHNADINHKVLTGR